MKIPVRSRSGVAIDTVEDWKQHASTKGKWQAEFSAMELARLWLDGAGPQAVVDALAPVLPDLRLDSAVAEAQISFDKYKGGVRNHDVLAFGQTVSGGVVVGVEGKVNESLDATVARKYDDAAKRKRDNKNTNLDKRVDALLLAIAGRSLDEDASLGVLRYQLFSAVAGTLAAADADTVAAAVLVHLIHTSKTKADKLQATHAAIADFGRALKLESNGTIVGPLELNSEHADSLAVAYPVPCWIALVETPALA